MAWLGERAARTFGDARRGWRWLVDAVLPPLCPACGRLAERPQALCAPCWSRVDWIDRPVCDRLGLPLPFAGDGVSLSPAAIAAPPAWARARAAARYEGPARDIVHGFKYADRPEGAALLAAAMARAGRDLLADAELIVPVPLHRVRLAMRRYNQAAVLAHELGRLADRPVATGLLARVRPTRQQVGLTARQRRDNVGGAFRVAPASQAMLAGRRVLLVDDVLTTGATLTACTRTLLKAGAGEVDVIVFARVAEET